MTMDDETSDPALQFFEEGNVDLYGALGVSSTATDECIRKAYRRCALKYHPDKQRRLDDGGAAKAEAEAKFQQIGFAYAVLSSPSRRKRFDATGQTSESMFNDDDDGDAMDWNAYFRELWTGEVNANTLDEFKKTYQTSNDERSDILDGYRATKGHFVHMVDHVPYMSLRVDRERVEAIVEQAIANKEVKRTKQWDTTRKDTRLLKRAEQQEQAEESEAMEMAREMGVYDALFGDDAAKANARSTGQTRAKKRKQKDDDASTEEDISALQNLIVRRNQSRGSQMDTLIAKLEAKAAQEGGNKKKKKAATKSDGLGEPSEEDFARVQAELDAHRRGKAKRAKA